jgi:murein DD-endopeptidase MepM/ murein hydrolase activator NlpD
VKTHLLLLWLCACIALTACGDDGDKDRQKDLATAVATLALEADAPATPAATSTPDPSRLRGFDFPIASGCLPQGDQLMPNAPRPYRAGIHEGVDIYAVDSCVPIRLGTPVLAAKDGVVVRADLAYVDLTPARAAQLEQDPTTPEAIDAYRGRQVWVDHGDGIVTRYAHLSGIAPGITAGTKVTKGQHIAYVGESGTPDSLVSPGSELHLHFEVRVGDTYLGARQPPAEVRRLFVVLFGK